MESRDGEERPTCQHGEHKDHCLLPQSGSSEKNLERSPWRLTGIEKRYLLWWMVVLDPLEMKRNQRHDPIFRSACRLPLGNARLIDKRIMKVFQVDLKC